MNVKIRRENNTIPLPEYKTIDSAGFDLVAYSFKGLYAGEKKADLDQVMIDKQKKGFLTLRPHERLLIGTGLYMQIPSGYELQIRPRSGLAYKKGLTVVNSPGTIDADYRGEIGIVLINTTSSLINVQLGERVAQGVLNKIEQALWEEVDELDSTVRGEGGFGSTGTK